MVDQVALQSIPLNTSAQKPVELDRSFYTWTTLFKGILGYSTQEEIKRYNQVYDEIHASSLVKRAEENRDWLFQYSPIVRFLRNEIYNLGGDLGPWNVRCKMCTGKQRGGFDKEYGILLCANIDTTHKKLEETMAHEMVHAYDALRWKFDELNMKHAACTEVCTMNISPVYSV